MIPVLPTYESEKVEFKISFNSECIETLVAFANAKGGSIYIGVKDDGSVAGVAVEKETIIQWINEVKSKTAPQLIPEVDTIETENKIVVRLSIAEYPVKPIAFRGRYYKRIKNSNHLLTIPEVVNMHLQSVNSSWDFYVKQGKTLEDIDLEKVQRVIDIIASRKENIFIDDPVTFLRKNELFKEETLTNACYLLFCEDERYATVIDMGRFATETQIKDHLTLDSDIIGQVEKVMDFLRKHINQAIVITGESVENQLQWQYPLEALREIVLNMIVHRDYTSGMNSIIKIFDDRIDFFNPGTLPDSISIEQLLSDDYVSNPRNKQIASVFKEMGLIERYGTGIKKVRTMFSQYGCPLPEFQQMQGGTFVRVFAKKTVVTPQITPLITPQITPQITELEERILGVLKQNPTFSRNEIAETLKIGTETVKEYIQKLKNKKLIIREGNNRTGYWKVN